MSMFYALPSDQYHAEPRLNNSSIKQLLKSPAHYQAYLSASREPTKAMIIGSATHTAVLEPHLFDEQYIVAPDDLDKRTKEGKTAFAELLKSGKTILTASDHAIITAIAQSVLNHFTAKTLLSTGNAEVSIYTDIDGVPAKCRMDWLRPGLILDLKTTDDASPSGFSRSVAQYGYDVQAAWYIDCAKAEGLGIETFIFIAVEKEPPYAVGIYELDTDSIEVGRRKYQRALSIWKHCTATDEWPGYSEDIITIQMPAWAMKTA